MPEVDSESQVSTYSSNNNDRKISCETLANGAAVKPEKPDELPPDFPPESFYLSKEAEFDWYDKNAFLERKESAKGNTSQSTNLMNSSSQRVPLTTNKTTTFFGLPSSSSIDSKRKSCKPVNIRFFPTKRSESALKAVSAPEPVSPKVSCMGRVRSKRSRRRSIEAAAKKCERDIGVKKKTGFYSRVFAMFRFSKSHNIKPVKASSSMEKRIPEEPVQVEPRKSFSVSVEPVSEPAGLGNMMRFKSGRRSGCWAAEEINVVVTESLDSVGPNGRN